MNLFEACPKLYFGDHALDYLLELPREKVLLVTDPFMVTSGTVRTVTDRLEQNDIPYAVFSAIEPDPSIETVAAGLQQYLHEKPETVIALGGGSAIDATKAILYFGLRMKASMVGMDYIHEPQFIAIPTTSGTGSEVTSYAVVSDRMRGVKIPLSHRSMIPDVAILDPDYTKTLPPDMVAFTGMDVLTHAVEAYVHPRHNDFTNMCARDAARKVLRYLPGLYSDVHNLRFREKMFTASTLAGLAFTNSGLGIAHGIAHTIGAEFHLPHGKANALVLPYVIAFNAGLGPYARSGDSAQARIASRYADLAHIMRVEGATIPQSCRQLVATVQVLSEHFGIPHALQQCGIAQDVFHQRRTICAEKILQDACTKSNPIAITQQETESLLENIYTGTLVI